MQKKSKALYGIGCALDGEKPLNVRDGHGSFHEADENESRAKVLSAVTLVQEA